ncbi:hypothetical protein Zmor_024610 [Zophobas morio]|uniref:Uncharacterized protein n=1 Tax=Zophobas morio TaxID=2755281 RepID=A0AA38M8V5_9CUCU|nr:hypothetical protein Zmor_024610 [Zophobas morio]
MGEEYICNLCLCCKPIVREGYFYELDEFADRPPAQSPCSLFRSKLWEKAPCAKPPPNGGGWLRSTPSNQEGTTWLQNFVQKFSYCFGSEVVGRELLLRVDLCVFV